MASPRGKCVTHLGVRQAMGAWQGRVCRDLGLDRRRLSCAQRTVLEAAAHAWMILRKLDAELVETNGPMPRETLRERQRVAWLLTQQLALLGRERGPLARRHRSTALPRAGAAEAGTALDQD